MKEMFQTVGAVILGLIIIAGIAFYSGGLGIALKKTFAPMSVAIDNKVFHESQQYNDGMIRDLENLKMAYIQTQDPQEKLALRATVLHRFSVYPESKMSPDLVTFYESLQGERNEKKSNLCRWYFGSWFKRV